MLFRPFRGSRVSRVATATSKQRARRTIQSEYRLERLEPRLLLATFTVDSLGDLSDGNFSAGNLSLREAIEQSNATVGVPDTIAFNIRNRPSGAVARYSAERDATDTAGDNHGTLQNGATFAPGLIGQAFSFDGVDDFVEVPDAAALDFGTGVPFSIEFWAFRTSTAPVQHLLGKRIGNSPNDYNYQLPFENVDLPLNTWTHVAHSFEGTTYRVYYNGMLFSETAVGSRIGPENNATLKIGTSGTAEPFGGLIDELAMYNRALAPNEVQHLFNLGSPFLPLPEPVSLYRGEENANDSADSNPGTLKNGTGFAEGQLGQAFSFDGVNDRVDILSPGIFAGQPEATIHAWVKPVGPHENDEGFGGQVFAENTSGVDFTRFGLFVFNNGTVTAFGRTSDTGSSFQLTTTDLIPLNEWTHLAATWKTGDGIRVYLNGIESASLSDPLGAFSNTVSDLMSIGAGGPVADPQYVFNGQIDEVGVHSAALSAAEVQAIFDAGMGPVRSLTPSSALPSITDPVTIDGYTQLGAMENSSDTAFNGTLRVELDGTNAGNVAGLDITAGDSTIRGLVINRFIVDGIILRFNGNNRIEGNFLGTDPSGTIPRGNEDGVDLESPNNTVGGTTPEARNVISGNLFEGVDIDVTANGNLVQGNLIGTTANGAAPLGNADDGVDIASGAMLNTIGGTTPAARNVIAFNGDNGVVISSGTGNAVLGNSIHSNTGPGIDLNADGATANDTGDGDSGSNNLQNFPVLTSIIFNSGVPTIDGTLNSTPGGTFRIEFFANDAADPSGFGEGQTYLGFVQVTYADGEINVPFSFTAGGPVPADSFFTANATDTTTNDTSEFSQAMEATVLSGADLEVTISDSPDPVPIGDDVTYTITATNHGPEDATGVVVVVQGPAGQPFNSVTLPVGDLSSGATSSFQLLLTPSAVGTFSVTAGVSGDETDPDATNNSFTETTLIELRRFMFEFSDAQYEVREGEPFALLTVRRTGDLARGGSVEFTTVNGTAGQRGIRAGLTRVEDFTTTSGRLFFRAHSNVATIRVPIGDDRLVEPDESFQVVLSDPSAGADLGPISSAEVVLHDNDPTVSFLVGSSERNEGSKGIASIEVRLTPQSSQTVTVAYAAVASSAAVGLDFTILGSVLTFLPGETSKIIKLTTINDTLFEGNETAIIELSSPTNAFLGEQTRHRVTIVDNDPQPPPVDPGTTLATALAMDLATLPRQSYQQFVSRTDVDTFRVELGPLEYLALDVDPFSLSLGIPALPSSTLTILDGNGATVLASVGRSAEPDGSGVTDNAAHLFQADVDGGTYYIQLSTTATGKSYGYSLGFHRIGVSENVPSPEQLNEPGPMYAWFDGVDTVGITGPTGYGFTLVGPWQQQVTQHGKKLSVLRSQTLTLPSGSQFTLRSPQGVELPLLANGTITISTKAQRWGDVVGVVSTPAIHFPVALDIAPLNDLLADVFGSSFATVGLLSGEWRISLGGGAFNLASGLGKGIEATEVVDQLLPGVPYLRKFGQSVVDANLGGVSVSQLFQPTPMNWIFDPADPMLYVKIPFGPGLAASSHALLGFQPQDPPDGAVDAGVTKFFGHVYANASVPLEIMGFPISIAADVVINVDADRDGKALGDGGDLEELFDLLKGDSADIRTILRDIQLGANGQLSVSAPAESKIVKALLTLELGRASVVLNGLAETVWLRGEFQGRAFGGTSVELVDSSVIMEGLIDFGSNDFLYIQKVSSNSTGLELGYEFRISNQGVSALVTGRAEWSARIDYGVGTVSGKAIAEIGADIAIEIDDDGDVHLSGSVSASGKLRYKGKNLFSGSIEANVRSRGFRFRFPLGVGNLDLDIF